jgi:hypothetical protein
MNVKVLFCGLFVELADLGLLDELAHGFHHRWRGCGALGFGGLVDAWKSQCLSFYLLEHICSLY